MRSLRAFIVVWNIIPANFRLHAFHLFLFFVTAISEHFMNTKNRMNVNFCPFLGIISGVGAIIWSYSVSHTYAQLLLAAWIDVLFNRNEQSYVMWQLNASVSL